MAIQSALSSGNLTALRSNNYRALQFLALCPNKVMLQFRPRIANEDNIYALIPFNSIGITQGATGNVRTGMTVVYSTTTDYARTEVYRNYVRKTVNAFVLAVGECGQSFDTSTVITVINTYEPFTRPRVLRDGVEYADWDIEFRRLLPIETALPTAVVLTKGTVSWSPTAVPLATDADATTSFTHSWESSNGNDLVSNASTASPTFTLQANSFRWIRYEFTDSNDNENYRVIAVWTVPTDYSNVNLLTSGAPGGDFADISYDVELGYIGSVPAFDGVSGLLRDTFCCVFIEEWINGTAQSIDGNVQFVGYLSPQTTEVRGDERFGRISSARFAMDGLGLWMSRIAVPKLNINRSVNPGNWGDIEDLTVGRTVVYTLSEHTTFLNLMALTLPNDDEDFTASADLFVNQEEVALDAVNTLIDILNAKLQWHPNGRAYITRRLVHLDNTARNAAPTIVSLTASDFLDFSIELTPKTINFLQVFGGVYTTATGEYTVYQAFVPPKPDLRGTETIQVVNQLLEADSSFADAQTELAERAANRYGALSPTFTLRGTLKDEWGFLVPDVGAWYKITISSDSNPLGLSFSTSQRWQLLEIQTAVNQENGTREVGVTFRLETQDTGANIDASVIENDVDADVTTLPAILPPYLGDLGFTGGDWFDTGDTATPSDPTPPGEGCEAGGFRVKDGTNAYATTTSASPGQQLDITVRGSGRLAGDNSLFDSFSLPTSSASNVSGSVSTNVNQVYRINVTGTYSYGTGTGDILYNDLSFGIYQNKAIINDTVLQPVEMGGNASHSYDFILIGDGSPVSIRIDDINHGDNVGSLDIEIYEVPVYGDAFYWWSEYSSPTTYPSGKGFEVDNDVPAGIPPYSESHEYRFFESATGGAVDYGFDNIYAPSQAENWSFQVITCFGS